MSAEFGVEYVYRKNEKQEEETLDKQQNLEENANDNSDNNQQYSISF